MLQEWWDFGLLSFPLIVKQYVFVSQMWIIFAFVSQLSDNEAMCAMGLGNLFINLTEYAITGFCVFNN